MVVKMTKKERVKTQIEVLEMIATIWKEYPEMRFGQLLINLGCVKDDVVIWNIQDEEYHTHLKGRIKSMKKNGNPFR
jgi:hypothetical protein